MLTVVRPFGAEPFPRATPESVGLNAAKLQEATDVMNRFVAEKKIAGAVAAVARRGKLAYLQAVGVQDLESRAPMTDRSMFRIYSMTKPVTAVAAMMLHERGRFALNDPVSKFIPEFKNMVVSSPEGTTRPPRARDHRAGPPAAHVGRESSDLTALSAREGSLARAGVAGIHREHRARAAHGGSRDQVPVQREPDRGRTIDRDLVGRTVSIASWRIRSSSPWE